MIYPCVFSPAAVVQSMNFRPGDTPVDIGVLPRGNGDDKESDGKSLLVLTTKGFGKRVDTDEFKLTRRWDVGRAEGRVVLRKIKSAVEE